MKISRFLFNGLGLALICVSGCAGTTQRENDFNARLKIQVEESQSAKVANDDFANRINTLVEAGGKPDKVREMLLVLGTWPGIAAGARKARELIRAADVELDRPDLDLVMRQVSPPISHYLEAYRFVIEKADPLQTGIRIRKEALSLFARQLQADSQGPSTLIEAAIDVAILKSFAEHGWLTGDGGPESETLDHDFSIQLGIVRKLNRTSCESGVPYKYFKEKRLACVSTIQDEMALSSQLKKRVATVMAKRTLK